MNKFEHDTIVDKLIAGGSLLGEAEQIIAARKTAYNKAMKEFKRLNPKSTPGAKRGQKGGKLTPTQSKRNNASDTDYAY